MLKLLFRLLLTLLVLVLVAALLTAAIGPLLIDTKGATGAATPSEAALPESHFVTIPFPGTDGLLVHYLAAGPGPLGAGAGQRAFVLLHGFTFNAFTWDRLLPLFGGYGPALAYDQIPYGLSAKPLVGDFTGANPYGKAAAVEQLFTLLDTLGVGQVVLVGNSSGGTLALEAALAHPERVDGLILLAPWVNAKRPQVPAWLAGLPQMHRLGILIARQLGTDSPLLDYSYADPTLIDDQRRARTGVHRAMADWDLAWGELLRYSLTDPVTVSQRLGEVRQPVLVITGNADRVVPPADTEAAAAALPNARLVSISNCGHLPQEECPAATASAIRDWLQATGLGR